jgi:hypothetical protein
MNAIRIDFVVSLTFLVIDDWARILPINHQPMPSHKYPAEGNSPGDSGSLGTSTPPLQSDLIHVNTFISAFDSQNRVALSICYLVNDVEAAHGLRCSTLAA